MFISCRWIGVGVPPHLSAAFFSYTVASYLSRVFEYGTFTVCNSKRMDFLKAWEVLHTDMRNLIILLHFESCTINISYWRQHVLFKSTWEEVLCFSLHSSFYISRFFFLFLCLSFYGLLNIFSWFISLASCTPGLSRIFSLLVFLSEYEHIFLYHSLSFSLSLSHFPPCVTHCVNCLISTSFFNFTSEEILCFSSNSTAPSFFLSLPPPLSLPLSLSLSVSLSLPLSLYLSLSLLSLTYCLSTSVCKVCQQCCPLIRDVINI